MKKSRILSMLLVATMLSTCAISGTFAKYTTSGSANDSARVAEFGVTAVVSGTLFSNAYLSSGGTPTKWDAAKITDKTISVASAEAKKDNIVAPGTQSAGDGLKWDLSGTPEVETELTATVKARDIKLAKGYVYGIMSVVPVSDSDAYEKFVAAGNIYTKSDSNAYTAAVTGAYSTTATYYVLSDKNDTTAASNDYFPVKYNLAGAATATGAVTSASANAAAAAIAAKLAGSAVTGTKTDATELMTYTVLAKEYKTNFDYSTIAGDQILTWAWDFSTNDGLDKNDTTLGNMMVATDEGVLENGFVVAGTSTNDLTDVAIANGVVTIGSGQSAKIVANLITDFSVSLTVTQVD